MNQEFESAFAFKQWLSFLLQYSLFDTVTGHDHDFPAIGACIVPGCNGVVFTTELRQHLWDQYFTVAPGQLRPYGALFNKVRKA